MIVPGPDTTTIKENPGAGNSFGIFGPWRDYVWNFRDLFYDRGFMVNISPPVLNTDNTVVYTFEDNGGTTDTNGKQTAGLWTKPLAGTSDYLTGFGMFDQKRSFDTATHFSTNTAYLLSDAPADKVSSPMTSTGSFVTNDLASTINDVYELTEINYQQAMQPGTEVENPNKYSFSVVAGRSDQQLLSYDLQWGNDSAANYGPFNFSNADLLTMGTYLREGLAPTLNGEFASFSVDRSVDSVRGPARVDTNVINPDAETLEPVMMNITSSLTSRFDAGANMHISYTKTFTRYGG